MDRILLAVDGSEHSMRAATFAGELSDHYGALVDIVNVVSDSALVSPTGAFAEYARLENVVLTQKDLLKSAGTEIVAQAATLVGDASGKVDALEVMIGWPAHKIASMAEQSGADCIVMGRRGLSGFKGMLMGSVSHRVGQLTDTTLITAA